jgi:hypothetical protein
LAITNPSYGVLLWLNFALLPSVLQAVACAKMCQGVTNRNGGGMNPRAFDIQAERRELHLVRCSESQLLRFSVDFGFAHIQPANCSFTRFN